MLSKAVLSVLLVATCSGVCSAQVQGGGASAGIGRTYEAAGRSAAARDLQRKMGSTLVRAVTREKSTVKRPTQVSRPQSARPSSAIVPGPVDTSSATFFKPDPSTDTMSALANQLGSNETERQQLKQLFTLTKGVFEKEVAAKGRSNNLPAAYTFFIATTVTVYRDDPEPSDKAIDNLWDGMNGALADTPELANLTNAEKQMLYDMLVAFSGFVLAGYAEAKSSGDANTLAVFKTLSGELIRTILKTDPAKLRFTDSGLDIVS